jgi:hypothetical protein
MHRYYPGKQEKLSRERTRKAGKGEKELSKQR